MATPTKDFDSPNYDSMAVGYEFWAWIYSTGQITRAKCSQLKFLEPGARILYLGVGAGEDAFQAAQQGFRVTCLDISQGMLDQFQRKLDRAGLKAELICGDALLHDLPEHYDACMMNFFLNVFPEEQVTIMMKHATSLVRPDGMVMIADCACPQGWLPSRLFNQCYLRLGMGWYWLLGLAAWHKTYDYQKFFEPLNLTTSTVEVFRYFGFGPVLFWNIVAKKS